MMQQASSVSSKTQFVVLEKFSETEKWLVDIARESDAHRTEFGFVPHAVFREHALREGLYVLVKRSDSGDEYVGHLLFNAKHPRAKVLQILALPSSRGEGVASRLVGHLKAVLAGHGFSSIYARVAEDLVASNAFWERQGFYVQSVVPGGKTTGRKILVRCFQVDTPQLFGVAELNSSNPLGLLPSPSSDLPLFLLDMNVLFDLQPRRLRRDSALGLVQAERMNLCRLAISDEIRKELQKKAKIERHTDPMEALIDSFPCVPVESVGAADETVDELAKIVFPHVNASRPLNSNERSDLRHIVAVINNDLAGLVTSDFAILESAAAIQEKFGAQVLSPASFMAGSDQLGDDRVFESSASGSIRLTQVSHASESKVRMFLSGSIGLSGSVIALSWISVENVKRVTERYAVWDGDDCVAYVTWPNWSAGGDVPVRMAVDESRECAIEAARIALMYVISKLCVGNPRRLVLELPKNQSILREIASGIGFSGGGGFLAKTSIGSVVTEENWSDVVASLVVVGGPKLPSQPPSFHSNSQQIMIYRPDGHRIHLGLDHLETLLSPVVFCLSNRPAVITPIRRDFAESLLGHSSQGSLLPEVSASLFAKRIYISGSPGAYRYFRPGTVIFFYESGANRGNMQLVALARVRESYLKNCDAIDVEDLKRSVLTANQLQTSIGRSKMKTVVAFDNVLPIPRPIGLQSLVKLGCGNSTQLQTTRPITGEQYRAIVELGFGRD